MSKLIVEMEMPKNCAECLFVTPYSRCVFLGDYAIDESKRADKCPIRGVLPEEHGDLIDRDELLKDGMMYSGGIDEDGLIYVPLRDVRKSISNAQTVIAAERKDYGR